MKIKIKFLSQISFITLGLVFIIFSSTEANQKPSIHSFQFTQIKPLSNLIIPDKYSSFWNDILNAKKQGKNSEEISALTKSKYGIGEKNYESVLKEMGINSTLMSYVKECMLNKKPVLQLLFKGAVTPPKATAQYNDLVEAILPAVFETLKPYEDRFRFKNIIYAGGILGDEPDYIRKIKLKEIQWAGGTIALGEMISPATSLFDLPFLIDYEPDLYYNKNSYCEVDWIMDKIAPTINQLFEKKGFTLMTLADGGSYCGIATNRSPITKVEDLENYTFFLFPQSRISGEINKAMGFSKSIVCKIWDLPSLAATGMLDSVVCCWYWHIIIQATPYYKYVTDYPLRGFNIGIAMVQKEMCYDLVNMGKKFGPMMSMDQKDMLKILRKLLYSFWSGGKEVLRLNLRIKEGEARRRLLKAGIYKEVKFPAAEVEKMRNKIIPLYARLADKKGSYPKWFLDEVLKYRAEYRKFKKEGKLTKKWYDKSIFPDGYDPYKWTKEWNIK